MELRNIIAEGGGCAIPLWNYFALEMNTFACLAVPVSMSASAEREWGFPAVLMSCN